MISIIIPCRDEEKNIGDLIKEIKRNFNLFFEIIVVDNNSIDKTALIARKKGARVIREKTQGKGRAMIKGAQRAKGDILVFIDGDGSYNPKFIFQLIFPIIKNKKDLVYGSRFLWGSNPEISFLRLLGNKLFSFLGNFLYQKKFDFLTGLLAIKKDKFLELNLKSIGFEIETEIFTRAIKKEFKIEQVPVCYKKNKHSKINPLFDGFKIFFTLLKNKAC